MGTFWYCICVISKVGKFKQRHLKDIYSKPYTWVNIVFLPWLHPKLTFLWTCLKIWIKKIQFLVPTF